MVNINEKLEQGYIQIRAIIEVLGKPREHVEKTMGLLVENIKKVKEIEVLKEDLAEPRQQKNEIWTTFAELEMLVKNTTVLKDFCFNFMPSSIEIIAPKNIRYQNRELAILFNDLQAKLHILNTAVKKMKNENLFYKKNMNIMLTNFISILLYKSGKNLQQIAKLTGFTEKNIGPFLNSLVKQEKIEKKDDVYSLR